MTKKFTPADIRGWQDKYEWPREQVINGEIQDYEVATDNNAPLVNGGDLLALIAKKKGNRYTSAVFISKDKVTVKTGDYVEARLKLPGNAGCWPAFWLLREDAVWQKTEIDIIEGIKDVNEGKYHVAMHSHVDAKKTYQALGKTIDTGEDLTGEFHNYGVFVDVDKIDYFFDGQQVASVPLHDHEKGLSYYMLLNLAVAPEGHWAGGYGPYEWEEAIMYVKSIIVNGPESDLSDAVVEVNAGTTPVDVEIVAEEYSYEQAIAEAVKGRYFISSTLARLFYDLARFFGGKL